MHLKVERTKNSNTFDVGSLVNCSSVSRERDTNNKVLTIVLEDHLDYEQRISEAHQGNDVNLQHDRNTEKLPNKH